MEAAVSAVLSERVQCGDKGVYKLTLLLSSSVETGAFEDRVAALYEVIVELGLDGTLVRTILLRESERSQDIVSFVCHCIDEGTDLDIGVLARQSRGYAKSLKPPNPPLLFLRAKDERLWKGDLK